MSHRKSLLCIVPDLSYDQAEDCASHIRQRQDRLDWCESARRDLPGVRDDLPCAEWYVLSSVLCSVQADNPRFPQGLTLALETFTIVVDHSVLPRPAPQSPVHYTLVQFPHGFGFTASRFNIVDCMQKLAYTLAACCTDFDNLSLITTHAYQKGVRSRRFTRVFYERALHL